MRILRPFSSTICGFFRQKCCNGSYYSVRFRLLRQAPALVNVSLHRCPFLKKKTFFEDFLPACLNNFLDSRHAEAPLLQEIELACTRHEYLKHKMFELENVMELDRGTYSTEDVIGIRRFLGQTVVVRR